MYTEQEACSRVTILPTGRGISPNILQQLPAALLEAVQSPAH